MNARGEQLTYQLTELVGWLRSHRRPLRRRIDHLQSIRKAMHTGLWVLALASLMRKVGSRRALRIAALVIGAQADHLGRGKLGHRR